MKRLKQRLKRAALSLGFVVAAELNHQKAATKYLIALTQDQFAPDDAEQKKQWEEWHAWEKQMVRPAWMGKPRPSLAALMRENLNKEVLRRAKSKGQA